MRAVVVSVLLLWTIILLSWESPPARADSVSHPPGVVREWSVTATTASQNVVLSGFSGQAINVINDGTQTVYITTTNTSSNSPTNGDEFFTVGQNENRSLDIQFGQFSYIAAAATSAIRVTVLSQN